MQRSFRRHGKFITMKISTTPGRGVLYVSEVRQRKYKSPLQAAWAAAIIKRDKCCQFCGSTEKLTAHHIIPLHIDRKKALDLDNGITLCNSEKKCHFLIGHLGSWFNFNPHIKEMCSQTKKAN